MNRANIKADTTGGNKAAKRMGAFFGTVKFYDTEKDFGFIKPDNGDKGDNGV